jgi:hypothetical protein
VKVKYKVVPTCDMIAYGGMSVQHRSFLTSKLYAVASGFGGVEVACCPLVPKFAGSHPAKAVGFLGRKNPQHAFLRRGSKAVGLMS